MTINVAQDEAGEGYRDDVDNKVAIKLQKGQAVYSLDLDPKTDGFKDSKNAATTKAIVEVDETYGKVTVTFKMKQKLS